MPGPSLEGELSQPKPRNLRGEYKSKSSNFNNKQKLTAQVARSAVSRGINGGELTDNAAVIESS